MTTHLVGEHPGVGAATHDVLLVERLVEGDGLAEALDGVGDTVLEPPAPQLGLLGLLLLLRRPGLGGCHGLRGGGEDPAIGASAGCGRKRREAAAAAGGWAACGGGEGREHGVAESPHRVHSKQVVR